MLLEGRLPAGASSVQFFLPWKVFPVGRLLIRCLRFDYCNVANHHNHFAPAAAVGQYPAVPDYQDEVRLAVPAPPPVYDAYARRRSSFRQDAAPPPINCDPPERVLLPREMLVFDPNAPDGLAAAAVNAAAVGGAGGGGGQAPFAPEDEELVRQRRQAGDRRRDVLTLEPMELGITMGYERNARYQRMIDVVPPVQYDRDMTNMTLEEIVKTLDAALSTFEGNLGGAHAAVPNIKLRELTPAEKVQHLQPQGLAAEKHRICELTLPAKFGLALTVEDHFKMLGLYQPVQQVKKNDKTFVFGGANFASVYLLGETAPDGRKYSVFSGTIPLKLGSRGATLLANRLAIKKKSTSDVGQKQLILAPRLVLVPSELEWAINLGKYSPQPSLRNSFRSFVMLHDILMDTACELFGFLARPYGLDTSKNNKFPILVPAFDASSPCASFFVEVVFGSQELADVFGVSGEAPLPLMWSTAKTLPEQNFVTLYQQNYFTDHALDQWVTTIDALMNNILKPCTKADRDLLRLHWGNIVTEKTSYMDMTRRGDLQPPFLQVLKQVYDSEATGARARVLPGIPEEDEDDEATKAKRQKEKDAKAAADAERKRIAQEIADANARKKADAQRKKEQQEAEEEAQRKRLREEAQRKRQQEEEEHAEQQRRREQQQQQRRQQEEEEEKKRLQQPRNKDDDEEEEKRRQKAKEEEEERQRLQQEEEEKKRRRQKEWEEEIERQRVQYEEEKKRRQQKEEEEEEEERQRLQQEEAERREEMRRAAEAAEAARQMQVDDAARRLQEAQDRWRERLAQEARDRKAAADAADAAQAQAAQAAQDAQDAAADALNQAWMAQQALVPPPPDEPEIVRRLPNPEPAPQREFVYFQPLMATSRCEAPRAIPNTNFPRRFYLMSEEGDRRDYIAHYGPSCVAGCFSNLDADDADADRLLEEGPLSEGFILENFTSSERTLRFNILRDDLTIFHNELDYDAFVRGTFSMLRLSPTMHNPLF